MFGSGDILPLLMLACAGSLARVLLMSEWTMSQHLFQPGRFRCLQVVVDLHKEIIALLTDVMLCVGYFIISGY